MQILYFALLRERIGKSAERLDLPADVRTIGDLARFLSTRGEGYAAAFADLSRLRAARDQVHASFETEIDGAAEIAFFPPVTGG